MDDLKKMIACEMAVERRLEKSCERDGWVASAHVAFGWDYVDCQLEGGQTPCSPLLVW